MVVGSSLSKTLYKLIIYTCRLDWRQVSAWKFTSAWDWTLAGLKKQSQVDYHVGISTAAYKYMPDFQYTAWAMFWSSRFSKMSYNIAQGILKDTCYVKHSFR